MAPLIALAALLALGTLAVPRIAAAEPVELAIDSTRSALHARLYKAGVASALAHDHVIAATEMSGVIRYDPERPDSFAIDITVPTASLEPDHPRLRKRYRLEGELDADDRATIAEHMKADDQLAVKRYPHIRFVSTAVKRTAPGEWTVEGDLTVRGETRRVSLPVRAAASATAFEGRGELRISHSQFGFEPYSAMLGAVKNQDRIDLILHIVAGP